MASTLRGGLQELSRCSFATVFLESLEEVICVSRSVVVDNIGRIVRVNFVNVLAELGALLGLDFLNFLEATTLNEGTLGFEVLGKDLSELGADVGEDVVRSELEEGLEGGDVSAHLDNVFESFLGFVLKVLGRFLEHVDGKESGRNISLSKVFSVFRRVSTDLSERPGSSSLQVILRLVHEGILEGSDSLGDDNSHSERVIESRDVSEGHDTRESSVSLRLTDIVNSSGGTTRVDDELSELSSLLSNFSDASSSVLSYLNIDILKAVKDSREDLSFDNDFSEIDGVLGDLGEALAYVSLELGIGVRDESSKVWDGTLVNNGLSKLFGVLGDLGESGGTDSLQGELGFLDTKDEETDGTGINNGLSELVVVLSNAGESKGSSFLDGGIEFFETVDEGIKSSRVNDSLSEVRGVLGNGSQNVSSSLLVESVLLG